MPINRKRKKHIHWITEISSLNPVSFRMHPWCIIINIHCPFRTSRCIVWAKKNENKYPLRSLNDILSELDKEWDKFRTGSLIGVLVSSALLIFSSLRLLVALRNRALLDFLFMIVVVVSLVYTIYAWLAQHRFFRKWERRIGLLLHLEDKLMSEELEKDH